MNGPTITRKMSFTRTPSGRRHRKAVAEAETPAAMPPRSIPRITRLMALAVRFDQLIRDGVVKDYAELARLGGVTRARVSQIMDLNLLAPDIQLAILFSSLEESERKIREWFRDASWVRQRQHIASAHSQS